MKTAWPVQGSRVQFERRVTEDDVEAFARLTGDRNPLHFDPETARRAGFGGPLIQGMLMAGLFSRLVGEGLGGLTLYLTQDLAFKRPAVIGETLLVQGEVIAVHGSVGVVDLRTRIISQSGELLVEGQARIKVLGALTPVARGEGQ